MGIYIGLYIYGTVCVSIGMGFAKSEESEYKKLGFWERLLAAAFWPVMIPAKFIELLIKATS